MKNALANTGNRVDKSGERIRQLKGRNLEMIHSGGRRKRTQSFKKNERTPQERSDSIKDAFCKEKQSEPFQSHIKGNGIQYFK